MIIFNKTKKHSPVAIDHDEAMRRALRHLEEVFYVKSLNHDDEVTINLDSTRVKQDLIYLLNNAIKYNKAGG